jgi:hypothetical protein
MTRAPDIRVAYVVLAYKNPAQVLRLVSRLQTGNACFVVHVDRRAGAVEAAIRAGAEELAGVQVVSWYRCHWGGFALVRAALDVLAELLGRGDRFDYAVFLSGQDYPVVPAEEIEAFLAGAAGRSFMTHWRLPFPGWGPRGGLDRVEDWHLVSRRSLHVRLPWRRRIPGGLEPFGGGAYWALAREVAEHVHSFALANPRTMRFFEHVLIPDELFFQTVVLNSPFAESVVNDHLRYVDWSVDPGPAILRTSDLDAIVASGKLFARKFDTAVDPVILDLLDRRAGRVVPLAAR